MSIFPRNGNSFPTICPLVVLTISSNSRFVGRGWLLSLLILCISLVVALLFLDSRDGKLSGERLVRVKHLGMLIIF